MRQEQRDVEDKCSKSLNQMLHQTTGLPVGPQSAAGRVEESVVLVAKRVTVETAVAAREAVAMAVGTAAVVVAKSQSPRTAPSMRSGI
jgi:hypothetical protein